MRKLQRISAFFLAIILMLGLSATAYAHDVPQMDRKGTIAVTMKSGDQTVGGGSLTIYRVGKVHEDDGNYTFQPAGKFADCGESFETVESPALAGRLANYADQKKLTGVTKTIESDGTVTFSDLELGLYLLVQHKAAGGYSKVVPFLVTLPYMESNGEYAYSVDAGPKVELKPNPESTTPPNQPTESTLPQTGQLNWPIPILAVLGLLMFAVGWFLWSGKRRPDEK